MHHHITNINFQSSLGHKAQRSECIHFHCFCPYVSRWKLYLFWQHHQLIHHWRISLLVFTIHDPPSWVIVVNGDKHMIAATQQRHRRGWLRRLRHWDHVVAWWGWSGELEAWAVPFDHGKLQDPQQDRISQFHTSCSGGIALYGIVDIY